MRADPRPPERLGGRARGQPLRVAQWRPSSGACAKRDERRRAMLHIMGDLNESNKRLANQRKAMMHILADYEQDRRRLARQTERLDNSRRALLHILQDSHKTKLRLEASRKAMIHIMGDLRETTAEMQRREQELRDKQEQLVQAGKLATLGSSPPASRTSSTTHSTTSACSWAMRSIMVELGLTDTERMCASWNKPCSRCARPRRSSPICAPSVGRPSQSRAGLV